MNRHWVLLYFIILFCYFISPACANNSFKELNPAEKFVILQVTKGKKADLENFQKTAVYFGLRF